MILEAGALAPPFTLLGIDGREHAFPREAEGEPVLLVFFKTTCATCDVTFPYLNRLRAEYAGGWQMWAIAQDRPQQASEYASRFDMRYPVLIDAPAYAVSRLYDPPATPTLFLVGPDGRVAYTTYGFAKADVNEVSRRIAGYVGAEPRVVAPAGDGRPDFKPG